MAPYYDLLYSNHDYDGDCALVERLMAKQGFEAPVSILDIGCGTGQHTLRFTERGHRAVGIDVSGGMLERARTKSRELGLDIEFHKQDMREMELDSTFDCAICLFGAFARLYTSQDISIFFHRLGKFLRPGGLMVLDFVNAEGFIDGHKSWKAIQDDDRHIILLDISTLSGRKARDHHEIYVFEGNFLVDSFVEEHDLQIHTFHDIEEILGKNGYTILYPENSRSGSRVGAIRSSE
jgi:SAM-dependent methyltransferase